jgi:hypothetical protein
VVLGVGDGAVEGLLLGLQGGTLVGQGDHLGILRPVGQGVEALGAALVTTSYTLVRTELDLVWETSA